MAGELGDGIALWLRFLHQLAVLFLLLFLINLTSFLFYVQANALPTDGACLAIRCLSIRCPVFSYKMPGV
eukprot:1807814-Rhodomonas_salina.4